jgi:hypothetical protein
VSTAALVRSVRERCRPVAAVHIPYERESEQQFSGKSVTQNCFSSELKMVSCLRACCVAAHPVCAILGTMRDRAGGRRGTNHGRQYLDAHCSEHALFCTKSVPLCPRPVDSESWDKHFDASMCGEPLVRVGSHLVICVETSVILYDEELIWARGGLQGCHNVSGHELC